MGCSTRLRWDAAVDPLEWQRHEPVFGRARASGVTATVVSRRVFEASGLTVASQRGAAYVGADTPGERISAVVHALGAAVVADLRVRRRAPRDRAPDRLSLLGVGAPARRGRRVRPTTPGRPAARGRARRDRRPRDGRHREDRRIDVDVETELLDGVNLLGARRGSGICTATLGPSIRWRTGGGGSWVTRLSSCRGPRRSREAGSERCLHTCRPG